MALPSRDTRRRLLPLILLLGAVLASGPLLSGARDRRELIVRFDQPDEVTAVSLVLRDGEDALWGTERSFPLGSAPPHLRRTLPLPAGRYELIVQLTAQGRPRRIERHFDVADDASEVIVPLR